MEGEKLQILKMVQEGKVTAEEAAKLLQAVDAKPATVPASSGSKWLRIRVQEEGRQMVNVNLPMSLVEVALSMGLKFVPPEQMKDIDVNSILVAIRSGLTGKIVEVDDGNVKVDIIVE